MNVLVISNLFPSRRYPSFGIFVKNFCDQLTESGCEVNLVVIKGKAGQGLLKVARYSVFFLKVFQAILFSRYDLVYVHYGSHPLIPLAIFRRYLKKSIVINFHGEDLVSDKGVEAFIRPYLTKLIESAELIVVPSQYFYDVFRARYANIHVTISPSGGIDLSLFHPKEELSVFPSVRRFGFVARIEQGKGWKTLLKSLENLMQNENFSFELDVVGNGTEFSLMRSEVKARGMEKKVIFHGELDHFELAKLMRSFHFLVIPSELDESLGLVGLEAMSTGIPVIATDQPAFRTYIDDKVNGWLYKKGDSNELTNVLSMVLNIKVLDYLEVRNKCIFKAREFDHREVSKVLVHQLKKLIE
jgi:glycosyltransferase involved in cell wall biosynthesis